MKYHKSDIWECGKFCIEIYSKRGRILSKYHYSGSLVQNELSTQYKNIHFPLFYNDG